MNDRDRLLKLSVKRLEDLQLISDQRYKNRLKKEIKEIDAQGEHEYLISLHDKFRSENLSFPYNENNSLVDFLLGLAPNYDIDKPYSWTQGEMPDVDVDFNREVRDDLKRIWAPETFGRSLICEIGSYGTSGIKSAMLDTNRVYSLPRDELQAITSKMLDKDDEGHDLEWEKALEIYPEFKAYCEKYPHVARDAKLLLDRNKSGGVHAAGLIISDRPLDGFLPLEVRLFNKDNPNGVICSAWTEGLNRQDLQPVGLIKFDLLVINDLTIIALACHFIKERHGLEQICALPGQWDWSDISYLNDPKSIEMANRADLKGVFQFDSEGIRRLVKRGGVTSFDDLPAYSAIYRPSCLRMGMDVHYTRRKKGEEPYNVHPLMEPILGKTYGVMLYQEQITDILRVVGNIPDMHTEKVRKAISKKKIKDFAKYKEMFIANGQINLNVNVEYMENLYEQVESFAGYGFNKSHACAYSYISARMLWLKAHYPLEFYAALLMGEKDQDKMKEYKLDAKNHGIDVCSVHINKSKVNFSISDNKIYFGFSNIKKIGKEVAARIVAQQPYKDFTDFLQRFGTELAPIKSLVALGVFEDKRDRITLRKFADWYKKQFSARNARRKRFEDSMEKKQQELRDLLLEEIPETDPDFAKLCAYTPEAEVLWEQKFAGITREITTNYKGQPRVKEVDYIKLLQDLAKKRETSIQTNAAKEKYDDEGVIHWDKFNNSLVTLDPEEEEILLDELSVNGEKSYPKAESKYYGFQWTHMLETLPEYTGATLDKFLNACENEGMICGMVEVEIVAVRKRTSKSGVEFYSIDIVDANGKKMVVNVWKDDQNRFSEELHTGHFVKMRVKPPGGGFNTLTFESVPKHERKKLPPKEEDHRLIVMKVPAKVEEEVVEEEPAFDDFSFDFNVLGDF